MHHANKWLREPVQFAVVQKRFAMRMVMILLFVVNLLGCGATVHSQFIKKDLHLRDYKKVHLTVATGGSAISVTGAGIGGGVARLGRTSSGGSVSGIGSTLSVSHTMSGDDQIIMAAQDIAFSLQEMGFELVDKSEDADILLLFSIGTVRYDPLAWLIHDFPSRTSTTH
jgi:hypothetical protein